MTEEVIETYIEYKWYRKKEMYWEDNRGQGVFRKRKLKEAKWYRCPRQRRIIWYTLHKGKCSQAVHRVNP